MVFIFADGASRGNGGPSASSYIILDDDEEEICHSSRFIGNATNNEAEYMAVHDGVVYCYENGILRKQTPHTIISDSQIIINQLGGDWRINNDIMRELNILIKEYITNSESVFSYEWVPRIHPIIQECDRIGNQVLNSMNFYKKRYVKPLKKKKSYLRRKK